MRSTDIALDMEKFVNSETPEISVVMPCLNEAETLATCIGRAVQALRCPNPKREEPLARASARSVRLHSE